MDFFRIIIAALILQSSCWHILAKALLNDADDILARFYRRISPTQCAENARLARNLCKEKVANSAVEVLSCTKIFINDYPRCYFPKSVIGVKDCLKAILPSYHECSERSITDVERITCEIMRHKLEQECRKGKQRQQIDDLKREIKEILDSKKRAFATKDQRASSGAPIETPKKNPTRLDPAVLKLVYYLVAKKEQNVFDPTNGKRSQCEASCMGTYEACLNNKGVVGEEEHVICLSNKQTCNNNCGKK